jgi:AcrR family transcriptional regulator
MSKQNLEIRRRWVADTTLGLVAREGLEAVTIRRIAAELGFSTAVVTHYYRDKSELLLDTFRSFGRRGRKSFLKRYRNNPSDVRGHLLSIAPVGDSTLETWKAFHALRSLAIGDQRFGEETRRYLFRCKSHISAFLRSAHPSMPDTDRLARRLIYVLEGIAAQRMVDETSWSAAQLAEELDHVLSAAAPELCG